MIARPGRIGSGFALLFLLVCMVWGGNAHAQGREVVITVEPNQSIRAIAEQYLGDPNLWEDILRANELTSPDQVRPGTKLKIPVKAITDANNNVNKSTELIQEATRAGAKMFAADEIQAAIDFREQAIVHRKAGEWSECTSLAKQSIQHAQTALNASVKQQDVASEAVLHFKRGSVQSRKPSDNTWYERQVKDSFVEKEKVRTLSNSYAEILFKNNSRIQLQENSQALIQSMRENRLTNSEQASVSLIEGDVLALLGGGKATEAFDFQVEGVETEINSQAFRVNKSTEAASFANYQGELAIAAAGSRVVLEENQGSVVRRNQAPSEPQNLLPTPELVTPANGTELYDTEGELVWNGVDGAGSYKIEIAEDAQFSRILHTAKQRSTSFPIPDDLTNGAYYWRVLAYTPDNLAGRMGRGASFSIILDENPPFLVVHSPEDGILVTSDSIQVNGATEPEATVRVAGHSANVNPAGEYNLVIGLMPGDNVIAIVATDRAGNETVIERTVKLVREGEIVITFDPSLPTLGTNRFVATGGALAISGTTTPQCNLAFKSITGGFEIHTQSDADGRFQASLPLLTEADEFSVTVTTQTGATHQENFTAEVDTEPPVISFTRPIPVSVANSSLEIHGTLSGGEKLTLNGKPLTVMSGEFIATVELSKGKNALRFEAVDDARNVGIQEAEVLYDPDAPSITGSRVNPRTANGGERVEITIECKDPGGLVKAAPFKVHIGDFTYQGVLLLNEAGTAYTGSFQVPQNKSGAVQLDEVTLTDRLGNAKTFTF